MRDTRQLIPETAPQNVFRWVLDAPRPLEHSPGWPRAAAVRLN